MNAYLGLLINFIDSAEIRETLLQIQHDLFDLGAELSQPGKQLLNEKYANFLEQQVEKLNADLPPLKEFILPGGSTLISTIHVARTVCRRVERSFGALNQQEEINSHSFRYMNRLSDFLFILARFMARDTDTPEVYWQSQYSRNAPGS